jgi:hypothetical protein
MEIKQLATVDKVDARRSKRLRQWQKKFLEALRLSPHVANAAKSAGVSREICYRTRRDNPAFAAQWQETLDAAIDDLEVVAFREAMRGNTQLTIFLLRAHRKSTYSETQRHEHLVAGKIILLPEKEEREP